MMVNDFGLGEETSEICDLFLASVYKPQSCRKYVATLDCSNDLSSFLLHFIINFVLTEQKLAHSPVEFQRIRIAILL